MVRMTVEAKGAKSGEGVPAKWAGEMRYVARQPILNAEGRVRGYELLFRSDPLVVSAGNGDMAARTMLDNAVLFGLERFTNGLPAFIRCSVEALTEQLVDVLAAAGDSAGCTRKPGNTPKLVDACRALKARGFRLALDDFCWNGNLEPLVHWPTTSGWSLTGLAPLRSSTCGG